MSEVDVWTEVFKYLCYKDLKEVSLVCHAFNNIISNSVRFLKCTKLVIKLNDVSKEDQYWKISRFGTYQHVKILNGDAKLTAKEVQHIEKFGDDRFYNLCTQLVTISNFLKYLEVTLNPIKAVDLFALLRSCDSLEKLKILSTSPVPLGRGEKLEQIKLTKLKSLKFEDSSEWILDYFDITELDELDITHDGNEDFDSSTCCMKSIIAFINKLTRLDSLALDDIDWDHCFELKTELQFRWKNLLIGCDSEDLCGTFSSTALKNLEILCKSSKKDGKAQFFLYYHKIPPQVTENVIKWCNCIDRISICVENLPSENVLAKMDMDGLKKLDELEIRTYRSGQSLQSLEIRLITFLSRIPKVKNLSVHGNAAAMLDRDICAKNFSNVKSLLFRKIDDYSKNLIFPSIEKLEVEQVKEEKYFEHLKIFGKNHPNLKKVEMFWANSKDYDRREILLNKLFNAMNKVQNFKIGFAKPQVKSKKIELVTGERNAMELKHFGKILTDGERDSGYYLIRTEN